MGRGGNDERPALALTRTTVEGYRLVEPLPSPLVGIRAQHPESLTLVSETLADQRWSSRDDGFFGSGAYFVSSADKVGYMTRGHEQRQLIGLDLSGQRLFRPASEREGFDLHDWLGHLNYELNTDPLDADPYDRLARALGRQPRQLTYHERLQVLAEQAPAGLRPDGELLDQAISSARADLAADRLTTDSVSTRVMRSLGYDGIDVRAFELLDTTRYGSVLYRPGS